MADKDKKDDKPIETMSKDELNGIFREIGGHIKQTAEVMQGLQKEIAELKAGGGGDKPNDDVDTHDAPDDKTIEEMSRGDFAKFIIGEIDKNSVAPLRASIQKEKDGQSHASLAKQVNVADAAHEDFSDWHSEIKAMIHEHPTMDVEMAYQLVRIQGSDKAEGIDIKLKTAADKRAAKEEPKKADILKPVFGGLLPTSGVSSTDDEGEMEGKDAGEAAWDACNMSDHLKAVSDD